MIYKLIILIASIFMIYEFTKSRSSVVAQFEPEIFEYIDNKGRRVTAVGKFNPEWLQ